MERADELARLETLDNGKPIIESRHVEIPAAAECFAYYAGWADKIHRRDDSRSKGNSLTYTLREPVGVVAAIVPWNFPLLLAAWKIAPALAVRQHRHPEAGEPDAADRAAPRASIAEEVGLPPGVLNVLTGRGAQRSGRPSSSTRAWTRSPSPARPPPARGSCAAPPTR